MPDSVQALPLPLLLTDTAPKTPPAALAGPRKAALPAVLAPQLATLVDALPSCATHWLFEIKYDGYRLLARIDGKNIRLLTLNCNDWTHRLAPLAKALLKMKLPSGWYDGEIAVAGEEGRPVFGALQRAFDDEDTAEIVYYLFDLPFFYGDDLRQVPLETRRQMLQAVRPGIGALLLGVYDDDGALTYAGHVGSGFTQAALLDLKRRLDKLAADTSAFLLMPAGGGKSHWVRPVLVAEISFGGWTRSGGVRQAVFRGLRLDKTPKSIHRELPEKGKPAMNQSTSAVHARLPATLRVSNPERVIDAASGATKTWCDITAWSAH